MKKILSLILFALSIALVNAQNPRETLVFEKLNLKSIESVIDEQLGKVDKETGALRVKRNEYFKSEANEAGEIALSYLQAKRGLYKLSDNPGDIKIAKTTKSPSGTYVYFEQYVNNIPVFATNFIVYINKENMVTYALNEFRNTATGKEIISIPSVNEYDALEFAKKYLDIKGDLIRVPKTELVYFESMDKGLELAWKINIISMKYKGGWQIFVSASDARIIHAESIAMFANGSGKVFRVNPLVSANVSYGYCCTANNCYLHY